MKNENTFIRDGKSCCAACGQNLSDDAHECDKKHLYLQSIQYRRLLQEIVQDFSLDAIKAALSELSGPVED